MGPALLDAAPDRVRPQVFRVRRASALGFVLALALFSREAGADAPLAESREWLRIGFYRKDVAGTFVSQLDASSLLSPLGKRDPAEELEATIASFSAPVTRGREDQHALCRFPARRRWLERRLGARVRWSDVECPAVRRHREELSARAVTLVYAANYLENPASAFGHTFLRFHKRTRGGATEGEGDDAIDVGVDYTAVTDTKNPVLYAFKGLTGLFPGLVRVRPYDAMLRDYAGADARDLWEYSLSLGQDEIDLLIDHLYELRNAQPPYLYLTDNCSYQLLAALEVAAPRLSLVSRVKAAVLPIDTLKAVVETPGLVRAVAYRPSVLTQFRLVARTLDERESRAVEALVRDPFAALPEVSAEGRARILDAAILAVDTRWAAALTRREPRALSLRRALVERRKSLSVRAAPEVFDMPKRDAPHESHDSMRLMLGSGGTSQYGDAFGELGFRLALHDLADRANGSPALAQVQFFDTRFRYSVTGRSLTLDTLTFAELMALHPLRRFETRLSWRARGFGMRLHDRAAPDAFAHGLSVALGAALGAAADSVVVFAMADAYVAFTDAGAGIDGSFVRVGVGPYGGMRVSLPQNVVALATGSISYLPGGQSVSWTHDVRVQMRAALAKQVAMGIEGAIQPLSAEVKLASYVYF